MNWTEIEGDWPEMKALVKSHWSRLSEADLARIEGDRGRLAEILCGRYGHGAEEAERMICVFEKEFRRPGAVK
ncbi:CsbD family protein [Tautonia plasticadhaerens]|uniref:CsbD-like domain-containing protein n=1 Tax=Tautonia plasticadhaerens TaxID=2527974 RepID=A0A518H383_9BACT|nr:CsbD family protein [Tautonia plasticadhaerens]QDV35305.1 hypothetical protein ElP_32080 [Tautonia plasticadhaerens]